MPEYVPSTPDPEMTTLVASLVRDALMILSTFGWVHGAFSDSAVQVVAGALVSICTVLWSQLEHRRLAKLDHDGSVRSAATQQPVKAVAPLSLRLRSPS
jgi:hypothetical protein